MAWLNRERRRRLRTQDPERDATYRVERDAPEWHAPIAYTGRWYRRASDFIRRVRFDAYPDHARPFEDAVPEPPVDIDAVRERLPRPRQGRLELVVVERGERGRFARQKVVPLAGATLEQLDLGHRLVAGWLTSEIQRVVEGFDD